MQRDFSAQPGTGQWAMVLKEGQFRLDMWRKFFTMLVVKHWHRLPKEVVDALSLETLKAHCTGL